MSGFVVITPGGDAPASDVAWALERLGNEVSTVTGGSPPGALTALALVGDGCALAILDSRTPEAVLEAAAAWAAGRRALDRPAHGRRPSPQLLLHLAAPAALPARVWHGADVCTGGVAAAESHSGVVIADPLDAEDAALALCARGPRTAVIDLAGEGAVVARGERATYLPPVTAAVVDRSGAGDCFVAALAHALVAGFDVFASTGWALAAAAACAARPGGAAESAPTQDDVERQAHSVDLRRDPGMMPVEFN